MKNQISLEGENLDIQSKLEIINHFSMQLLEAKAEMEVYKIMSEAVRLIVPGVYFLVSKLQQDDMNFRIVESSGFETYLKAIKILVGKDPFTIDFPFNRLTEKQIQAFKSRKLTHFTDGIHELVNGQLNKRICKGIEKLLKIADVGAVSFCVDKRYFGGVTFFFTESIIESGALNKEAEIAIEIIANQASTVIQRLRDRDDLRKNEAQLMKSNLHIETVLENSNAGYLFESVNRKIVKVNSSFCKLFKIPTPELLIGGSCTEALNSSASLFSRFETFIFDIEQLISENKPVYCQELEMKDGRILERDFIPIKDQELSGYLWQYRDITESKKNEIERIISQTQFNQLVNQLTDVIWKMNFKDNIIHDLNNSFERIYGYPQGEFTKNINLWIELVHPDDQHIAKRSNQELHETGNSNAEYRIIRPDGKIIWLYDRKSIVYDHNGTPLQMGGIASDITSRKNLEEQLQIKDYALDASPVAIGLADLKGIVFYANEAYAKLWGYSCKNDVLNKHISAFASTKTQPEEVIRTIREGKIYYGEGEPIRQDGSRFNCIISASQVLSEGKPICFMAIFIDITERKQNELKLNDLTKKLNEINATKDKFFSIIAHDLKAPFNSLLGFSDLLINDYQELSHTERLEYIKMINNSLNSVMKLLKNLLEWARIQQGLIKINKQKLNLKTLITESIEPYLWNAISKGISVLIEVDDKLEFYADIHSMNVVTRNLFNNALKYTNDGGEIVFSVSQNNDNIDIYIEDNGIGMSKAKLDKLFRIEVNQSTPGTKGEIGTGLGLILCMEFINRNNGQLFVESEVGKGTIFKITLPKE
jgi:PAS domain S-box-containing protein